MRSHGLSLIFQLAAIVCVAVSANLAKCQDTPGSNGGTNQVVLTRLSPPTYPTYPQLAQQARIAGDVRIQVQIHRDGSLASADAASGHRMLKPAALASAQNSKFQCHACTEELTSDSLTYSFGFREDGPDWGFHRLRSAKCLYLWRCGDLRSNEVVHPVRPATVTQSGSHITILCDSFCVQTSSANASGR
jgi:TonB family protein